MLGIIHKIHKISSNLLGDTAEELSTEATRRLFCGYVARKVLYSFFETVSSSFQENAAVEVVFKSLSNAFRKPRPDEKSEIASRIFVFPAPFSPKKTTNFEDKSKNNAR